MRRFRPPPMYPPKSWFDDPVLREPTALTVDDSGRVRGHACLWDEVHAGFPGQNIHPPREQDYRHFMTGEVRTFEAIPVATGRLSLGGGHAAVDGITVEAAAAHYDDVATAVGDIAVGADQMGLWMAGSLRPEVTEQQVRTLRASSVSADWRSIKGKLRLLAICAVNVAGFATPRASKALAASGVPHAVVAMGPRKPLQAPWQADSRRWSYASQKEREIMREAWLASLPPTERYKQEERLRREQDNLDAAWRALDSARSHGGR